MGLLDGVRILDLSRVLAGPFCTALLRDLGAEVIKVEPPGGDDARHLGPFRNGESVYFDQLNRGKNSVTLNLKSPKAVELVGRLVECSDVLVENFRPGVTTRLGIDYERMSSVNPRLVYASISGFGQTGPLAQRPAYDLIVQAMSGLMWITGQPDGPPTRVGESLGDMCAGVFAAWGICAALLHRERTGRGDYLDVAMFDSLLALQVTAMSQYLVNGVAPTRVGNRHPISTPFDTFEAADGLVVLAVANEALFARLASMIGQPELPSDPRFSSDDVRTAHEPELKAIIETWTRSKSVEDIVHLGVGAGIPTSPVSDLAEALGSEQALARDLVNGFEHPVSGSVKYVSQPVHFLGRSSAGVARSPLLGEHTAAVLGAVLGIDAREVEVLRQSGVVV
jgi:CoA:oxalate CoA-transferase